MHFCHEELFAIVAALPFLGTVFHWLRTKSAMLIPALFSVLFLLESGCTTIVYLPNASDAGVDDANADAYFSTNENYDADLDGNLPDAAMLSADSGQDTRSDDPPCPGLTSDIVSYRAETNTCLGTLANFQSISWSQPLASTCTWAATLNVEWCTERSPANRFDVTSDWAPTGPGMRSARFNFDCGGRVDCTVSVDVAIPGQATMTCTSGRETCTLHLAN